MTPILSLCIAIAAFAVGLVGTRHALATAHRPVQDAARRRARAWGRSNARGITASVMWLGAHWFLVVVPFSEWPTILLVGYTLGFWWITHSLSRWGLATQQRLAMAGYFACFVLAASAQIHSPSIQQEVGSTWNAAWLYLLFGAAGIACVLVPRHRMCRARLTMVSLAALSLVAGGGAFFPAHTDASKIESTRDDLIASELSTERRIAKTCGEAAGLHWPIDELDVHLPYGPDLATQRSHNAAGWEQLKALDPEQNAAATARLAEHVSFGLQHRRLTTLLGVARGLQATAGELEIADWKARTREFLVASWVEPGTGVRDAGGFSRWKSHTPSPSVTFHAIGLMEAVGVPAQVDLKRVRAFLHSHLRRPGIYPGFDHVRAPAAAALDRLDAAFPPAPRAGLLTALAEFRALIGAALFCALLILTIRRAPAEACGSLRVL